MNLTRGKLHGCIRVVGVIVVCVIVLNDLLCHVFGKSAGQNLIYGLTFLGNSFSSDSH